MFIAVTTVFYKICLTITVNGNFALLEFENKRTPHEMDVACSTGEYN